MPCSISEKMQEKNKIKIPLLENPTKSNYSYGYQMPTTVQSTISLEDSSIQRSPNHLQEPKGKEKTTSKKRERTESRHEMESQMMCQKDCRT